MQQYHPWSRSAVHAPALAGLLALAAISGCGGSDPGAPGVADDPSSSTSSTPTVVSDGGVASNGTIGTRPSDAGVAPAGDAGTGSAPSTPSGTGTGTGTGGAPSTEGELYPLPELPAAVAGIQWPTAPTISRTVNATTLEQANAAAAQPGTRVHVEGAIPGTIEIRANDVEIEFAPGASAGAVLIGQALARVSVRGGSVDHVEVQLPMIWDGSQVFRRELMTTDITIDGVTAIAGDTAFFMRSGIRVAIVNSTARAARYSVWFGDTADFNSEDVILAGNDFDSAAPEATVRLVHVVRSVTVDNRLTNTFKHNYRTHGRSRLNYASGNLLVNSGMMLGTMDGDTISEQWFVGNTIHHTTPSLLEIHLDVPSVTMSDNVIYSDVWDCLLCRDVPAGWTFENNQMHPYQPPPAR